MRSWFHERGYPKHLIQNKIENDEIYHHSEGQKAKKNQRSYICGYIQPLADIFTDFINKHFNILQTDKEAKNVFTPRSMITFHSARKLSSHK